MTDLVLRDRGERDVFLERGRYTRPFGIAPAEDQLVVSDLQQFLRVHARASAFPSGSSRRRGGTSCAARRGSRAPPESLRAGRPTAPRIPAGVRTARARTPLQTSCSERRPTPRARRPRPSSPGERPRRSSGVAPCSGAPFFWIARVGFRGARVTARADEESRGNLPVPSSSLHTACHLRCHAASARTTERT